MKRNFLFLLVSLTIGLHAFSQNVSINNDGTPPNPNAMLDIKASDKGLLIPRTSTITRLTIPNTKGLLVYDTTTSSFWYNDGTAWKDLTGDGSGWSLTGNSGTDTSVNFIGTTDETPLVIKVGNSLSGIIDYNGNGNTGFGYQALLSNTTGSANTAVGFESLKSNITGIGNTTLGSGTLANNNANYNTAVGSLALNANTSGTLNTATGVFALGTNGTGSNNSAYGFEALGANTDGNNNTANGYFALSKNNSGYSNTATGASSLNSNTTGFRNTAEGDSALFNNTTGFTNTAIGGLALQNNVDGGINTAIGFGALETNTSGSYNTAVGVYADVASGGLIDAMALGNAAKVQSSFTIQLGDGNITDLYTNDNCIVHAGSFVTPSDARLKNSITPFTLGLNFISLLKPVSFLYNNQHDSHVNSGFLAQDVEKAAAQLGTTFSGVHKPKTDKDFYALSYQDFIMPLVNAVKELKSQNDELKKDNDDLKKQLNSLSVRVSALENK